MKAGDKVYIKSDAYKAFGIKCGASGIVVSVDGLFTSVMFGAMSISVLLSELDIEQN